MRLENIISELVEAQPANLQHAEADAGQQFQISRTETGQVGLLKTAPYWKQIPRDRYSYPR